MEKIIGIVNKRGSFEQILKAVGKESEKEKFFLRKIINRTGEIINTQLEPFISHPNGNIFIPGSTIKGAIRTALMTDILDNEMIKEIYKILNKKKVKEHLNKKLKTGLYDKNNVHIIDIELGNITTHLHRIKRLGMGTRSANLITTECIEKNIESSIEIRTMVDKKELIEKVNSFYLKNIEEIKKIDSVKNNPKLMEALETIKNKADENNMILQIGHYGDYFTKSFGDLIKDIAVRENLDNEYLYKLRRNLRFGNRIVKEKFSNRKKPAYAKKFPLTFPITTTDEPLGWVSIELR
jgi:CRISPR/Cas system CSM-associated protein Csm5 (group 7 of RAMP superfamily)